MQILRAKAPKDCCSQLKLSLLSNWVQKELKKERFSQKNEMRIYISSLFQKFSALEQNKISFSLLICV